MTAELPVVLLVDDERHILSALRRSLRREGYQILTANSAEGALETLAEQKVDLVVSDQKMPGANGIALFAELERSGARVPRVLLTGWPEEIPAGELRKAGVTALLPKPWDDAQLKSTLRSCLAGSA
ncbi:MAG: hypothetical protein CL910_09510 [Deltaproteobacteria bacterium]|nr:hypothetical protein [Deltaproteobacteria bacterium]